MKARLEGRQGKPLSVENRELRETVKGRKAKIE